MTEDVAWDYVKKRYRAYLYMYGDRQFLGYFQTPEDAYMARTASAWCYVHDFLCPESNEGRYPRLA